MRLNGTWRMRVLGALLGALAMGLSGARAAFAQEAFPQGGSGFGQESSGLRFTPINFQHDVVFTLALGTDPATSARIAVTLARRLRQNGLDNPGGAAPAAPVRDAWIVPEGGWTLSDYEQQCAADPKTRGAFIVMPPAITNAADNYIAVLRSWTDVSFSVMVAECRHEGIGRSVMLSENGASLAPAPGRGGTTAVVWVSETPSKGKAGRSQIEFFPLTVLTSVYFAFAPQRVYQTTTVAAFPTPNPLPVGGARSSVSTVQSTTLNASGTGSLQGGVLSAFSGNGLGVTIGAQASPETQALHAADDAIGHLLADQLNLDCKRLAPIPAFCGW